MPYLRHTVDLSIPLSGTDADNLIDRLPAALRAKPTPAELAAMSKMTWFEIIRDTIKRLRNFSEPVTRPDASKDESSYKAATHICRHDVGGPCDAEEEIV